ncbi:DUF6366 family protein [Macrococcus equi]|uniref:DUF6366 family protein n=1 Tax=Macrococcus equi TaxID=3395462 RepID=UPI0039BEBE53
MSLSPEEQRERLKTKEIHRNAAGNIKDQSQNSYTGNLNGFSTKTLRFIILFLVIVGFIGWLIFN